MPCLMLFSNLRNLGSFTAEVRGRLQKRPRDFNYIVAIISENDSIISTAQGATNFSSAFNDFNASDQKKMEPSAADTEPITNLRREGKALQIETIY